MPILTNEERVGTILAEKYLLVRMLGEGGMGVVFEGRHEFTRRRVAVKLLHPHLSQREDMVARFMREARAAASLDHRNVVDVLDMGREADGAAYLVLEFLHGEPMSELLEREGALSADDAAAMLLPIMEALCLAHERGIVHRDIKPENIFLALDNDTGNEVAKLLDFGIAKLDDGSRSTATGQAMGTPAYMAPEQATNAADVGPQADVWSMGVLWFEALTRRLPYPAESSIQSLSMLMLRDPDRLSEVAPDLPRSITLAVERALARDCAARWPTMAAFLDALRPCFAQVDVRTFIERSGARVAHTRAPGNRVDTQNDTEVAAPRAADPGDLAADDSLVASPRDASRPSPRPVARPRWGLRVALASVAVLVVGLALSTLARDGANPGIGSVATNFRLWRRRAPAAPRVTPTPALDAGDAAPDADADADERRSTARRPLPHRGHPAPAVPGRLGARQEEPSTPSAPTLPSAPAARVRVMNW